MAFTQIFLLSALLSVSTHAEHNTHQQSSAFNETGRFSSFGGSIISYPKRLLIIFRHLSKLFSTLAKMSLRNKQWFLSWGVFYLLLFPNPEHFSLSGEMWGVMKTGRSGCCRPLVNNEQRYHSASCSRGGEMAQLAKGRHWGLCPISRTHKEESAMEITPVCPALGS